MSVSLSTHIQLRPVTIPVERYASIISCVSFLEFVEVHLSSHGVGEESKCYLVLGVGLREDVGVAVPVW